MGEPREQPQPSGAVYGAGVIPMCPACQTELVPRIRYGKDTGLLICPVCWQNFDKDGNRVENPFKRKQPGLRHKR